jgi:large subunit ribosomal protein L4
MREDSLFLPLKSHLMLRLIAQSSGLTRYTSLVDVHARTMVMPLMSMYRWNSTYVPPHASVSASLPLSPLALQAPLYAIQDGSLPSRIGSVDLNPEIFGLPIRADILQRATTAQLATFRQGTAKTKSRGEVHGTTKKMYPQKGTGRARHGARTAPIFRGGGTTHGPTPRDWSQSLPKKVRSLALKMSLSSKAMHTDDRLIILQSLPFTTAAEKDQAAPISTAQYAKQWAVLQEAASLPTDQLQLLVVGNEEWQTRHGSAWSLAGRNLRRLNVVAAGGLSVGHVLKHSQVVLTDQALRDVMARLHV